MLKSTRQCRVVIERYDFTQTELTKCKQLPPKYKLCGNTVLLIKLSLIAYDSHAHAYNIYWKHECVVNGMADSYCPYKQNKMACVQFSC